MPTTSESQIIIVMPQFEKNVRTSCQTKEVTSCNSLDMSKPMLCSKKLRKWKWFRKKNGWLTETAKWKMH